jgi:hypothetical protein
MIKDVIMREIRSQGAGALVVVARPFHATGTRSQTVVCGSLVSKFFST